MGRKAIWPKDVALDVDPRGNLDEVQAVRREREDTALGDVEHRLAFLRRERPAKGHLLYRLDELALPTLDGDADVTVLDRNFQPARSERAGEHQPARVLADVDEPARAGQTRAEAADVHVAQPVHLGHSQAGQVEPATVVKVELLVLVQERLRVDRSAEVEAALRHAPDHAGFGRERHVLEHPLFTSYCRDDLRHADAEVDDTTQGQLESAAASDQLSLVERCRFHAVDGYAHLSGESGVVRSGVGLPVRVTRREDDASTRTPGTTT
jgi:hypothetical protein